MSTFFQQSDVVSDECVWISQLVPYKRPDIAVDAFTRTGRPLHVIGDGPMLAALKARAGPNVRFTTRMRFDELRIAYAQARALIFTAEEDFAHHPSRISGSGPTSGRLRTRRRHRKPSSTAKQVSISITRPRNR